MKELTYTRIIWREFRKNRLAVTGAVVILVLTFVALFASLLAPQDPQEQDYFRILEGPNKENLLGTDDLGRDILSRMIYGSRISLSVGFVAMIIAITIGSVIGALAGYYGGIVDAVLMRIVEIMLSIPMIFLILAIIAVLGPSLWNVMAVIGLTSWPGVSRLVRAEFLTLKERDFAQAAKAVGAGDLRIIFRHILPNGMVPILVSATFRVAGGILTESALSFLGLGVQPPTASWGNMLSSGRFYIDIAWWLTLFPGLAILITVLAYNLLGEGLRDALDPRLRGEIVR
jgi:peptide/nickel transport system permease protein